MSGRPPHLLRCRRGCLPHTSQDDRHVLSQSGRHNDQAVPAQGLLNPFIRPRQNQTEAHAGQRPDLVSEFLFDHTHNCKPKRAISNHVSQMTVHVACDF